MPYGFGDRADRKLSIHGAARQLIKHSCHLANASSNFSPRHRNVMKMITLVVAISTAASRADFSVRNVDALGRIAQDYRRAIFKTAMLATRDDWPSP